MRTRAKGGTSRRRRGAPRFGPVAAPPSEPYRFWPVGEPPELIEARTEPVQQTAPPPPTWQPPTSEGITSRVMAQDRAYEEAKKQRRRRNRKMSLLGTAALGVLIAGSITATMWLADEVGVKVDGDTLVFSSIGSTQRPPKPDRDDLSETPLGAPPADVPASTSFGFLDHQADGTSPVTWDPCRPIHYVTSSDNVPAGGERMLEEALAIVSEATGLEFVNDGETDEPASLYRKPYQPEKYGERWVPVLIMWSSPSQVPDLAGGVLGLAGPQWVDDRGSRVDVTGILALDGSDMGAMGYPEARSVIIHELGHLVGLGHVQDAHQLMFPVATGAMVDYGDGDKAGLAQLGRGACHPDV